MKLKILFRITFICAYMANHLYAQNNNLIHNASFEDTHNPNKSNTYPNDWAQINHIGIIPIRYIAEWESRTNKFSGNRYWHSPDWFKSNALWGQSSFRDHFDGYPAQDSTALFKPKLSFGISISHDFDFKSTVVPCSPIVPSLYEGYTQRNYWQPSVELLYNYYLYFEKGKFLRNYYLTAGLKINYEKTTSTLDTLCSSTTSGIPIFSDKRVVSLYLPVFLSYKKKSFILRIGAIFSFFSIIYGKHINNNQMVIQRPRGVTYFTYDYLSFRVDYSLPFFKKINSYFFCYCNGLLPNEFGAGLGMPIKYNQK